MKTSENVYVVTATVAAVSRVSRTNALFLSATNLSAPPPSADDVDRATLTSATDVPIDSDAEAERRERRTVEAERAARANGETIVERTTGGGAKRRAAAGKGSVGSAGASASE